MASSIDEASDVSESVAADVKPETALSSSMGPSANDIVPETTSDPQEEKALRFQIMNLRLSELALRKYQPRLLGLPRELRDMIYSYTLTSPITRWDARHVYYCKHRDRTGISETPPFTMDVRSGFCNPGIQTSPRPISDLHACHCARHHTGLNFLRTNRQIRAEAMKIFYAQNVFCFNDGYDLRDFITNLNPECRDAIQHISVMGIGFDGSSSSYVRPTTGTSLQEQVWDALTSCSSLRRLELKPEHAEYRIKELLRLRENGVEEIAMVQCVSLQPAVRNGAPSSMLDRVWIGVSQPVELPARPRSVSLEEHIRTLSRAETQAFRDRVNQFRHTFVPQCREAVKAKLVRSETPRNLNASLDPLEVSVNVGSKTETWTVRVWGLPSTKEVRAKLAKKEWLEDEGRRVRGLPTRREEELNRTREEALKVKKSVIEARESQTRESMMKEREDKNAENERLNKIESKKKAKNQKTKLNRKIRRSEQDRSRERKRVNDV